MRSIKQFCFFLIIIVLGVSCDNETTIGTDVVNDEYLNIKFKNDFIPFGNIQEVDSVLNYVYPIDYRTELLGEIENPVFGYSSSKVFSTITLNTATSFPKFDESIFDIKIDSMVLTFAYDTLGFYGNEDAVHHITLKKITEDWYDRDTLYSNLDLATDPTIIGETNLIPNPNDSVWINLHTIDSLVKQKPQLRIKLNDAYVNELGEKFKLVKNDTTLREVIQGFAIESTVDSKDSFIALDMGGSANSVVGVNGLKIYFNQIDTSNNERVKSYYSFLISNRKGANYITNYSSSEVGQALGDSTLCNDYLYIQSMSGVRSRINFDHSSLVNMASGKEFTINYAELELSIAEDANQNTTLYEPISFITSSVYNDSGVLVLSPDMIYSYNKYNNYSAGYGGTIKKLDTGISVYKCNVTDLLKSAIENDKDFEVFLDAGSKTQNPRQTVLYGFENPLYAPKLNVTFTEL
ncbi:MAG TPA: DUF4270 family protein [Saprospiraceae bacterium]|nr:DUF4270 family protein [Saprospiraceae bacterium]